MCRLYARTLCRMRKNSNFKGVYIINWRKPQKILIIWVRWQSPSGFFFMNLHILFESHTFLCISKYLSKKCAEMLMSPFQNIDRSMVLFPTCTHTCTLCPDSQNDYHDYVLCRHGAQTPLSSTTTINVQCGAAYYVSFNAMILTFHSHAPNISFSFKKHKIR